ncbi:MAG: GNAT family N-acetyltransferase [Actinomycetota bacterium]|nr:GNAT family N-acetyltransferase [Actinomycetota bacterium]
MEHTVLHRSLVPEIPVATLYALLRLRVEVFVVEQACPYQELDGHDLHEHTRHFWLVPEGGDDVVATLRLLEQPEEEFRIGRVCAARQARGKGAARRLMEAALADVGDRPCVLDAQRHLTALYEAFGFVRSGDDFTEDGIAHVPMRRG